MQAAWASVLQLQQRVCELAVAPAPRSEPPRSLLRISAIKLLEQTVLLFTADSTPGEPRVSAAPCLHQHQWVQRRAPGRRSTHTFPLLLLRLTCRLQVLPPNHSQLCQMLPGWRRRRTGSCEPLWITSTRQLQRRCQQQTCCA